MRVERRSPDRTGRRRLTAASRFQTRPPRPVARRARLERVDLAPIRGARAVSRVPAPASRRPTARHERPPARGVRNFFVGRAGVRRRVGSDVSRVSRSPPSDRKTIPDERGASAWWRRGRGPGHLDEGPNYPNWTIERRRVEYGRTKPHWGPRGGTGATAVPGGT